MTIAYPSAVSQLARALSAPAHTRKLVLTLEVGRVPTIEYEVAIHNDNGPVFEPDPLAFDPNDLRAAVNRFTVRLQPPEGTES